MELQKKKEEREKIQKRALKPKDKYFSYLFLGGVTEEERREREDREASAET